MGVTTMVKTKIFFGQRRQPADAAVNEWLEEHEGIIIRDVIYQQPDANNHSICIIYSEKAVGATALYGTDIIPC